MEFSSSEAPSGGYWVPKKDVNNVKLNKFFMENCPGDNGEPLQKQQHHHHSKDARLMDDSLEILLNI